MTKVEYLEALLEELEELDSLEEAKQLIAEKLELEIELQEHIRLLSSDSLYDDDDTDDTF